MRRRCKWQKFNSKFGIVESLWRKLLDCQCRNCCRFQEKHFWRTSVCFKRQMDTFCLFKSIIQEILVKVLSLAETFRFPANIICYNDPNFLCWHNLLNWNIGRLNFTKLPELWSPTAENWLLFSFFWQNNELGF